MSFSRVFAIFFLGYGTSSQWKNVQQVIGEYWQPDSGNSELCISDTQPQSCSLKVLEPSHKNPSLLLLCIGKVRGKAMKLWKIKPTWVIRQKPWRAHVCVNSGKSLIESRIIYFYLFKESKISPHLVRGWICIHSFQILYLLPLHSWRDVRIPELQPHYHPIFCVALIAFSKILFRYYSSLYTRYIHVQFPFLIMFLLGICVKTML